MSSIIDTPIAETRTAPLEAPHRPDAPRPTRTSHGGVIWVVAIAACVAVVAISVAIVTSGGDDSDVPPPRFDWHAESLERQAHLDGQADLHSADRDAVTTGGAPSDLARFRAAERGEAVVSSDVARFLAAERAEQEAHLEAQADTYEASPVDEPQPADEDDAPEPAYLPGSRHVPTR
jgi:hypothetical protein